ncbi:hypothetical protein P7L78_25840 [Tistrella bauzanensis]|uniref:Uncharacterized protein n=1 Tax=Tistrella arctica TaxID=3133430 RepID=A0ABU9YKL5_9PROT
MNENKKCLASPQDVSRSWKKPALSTMNINEFTEALNGGAGDSNTGS